MEISLSQLLEFVKAYSAEVLNLGAETVKNLPKPDPYSSEDDVKLNQESI
jgi:hypothetical protein